MQRNYNHRPRSCSYRRPFEPMSHRSVKCSSAGLKNGIVSPARSLRTLPDSPKLIVERCVVASDNFWRKVCGDATNSAKLVSERECGYGLFSTIVCFKVIVTKKIDIVLQNGSLPLSLLHGARMRLQAQEVIVAGNVKTPHDYAHVIRRQLAA